MTAKNRDELEPIEPRTARELYLDHKASECADVTVQSHKYRTQRFVEWCEENGIDNMNDLSGRNLHEYRLWRKEDGGLNKVSIQTQLSTLRVFLKWCGTIEAVPQNLYDKLLIPTLSADEEQRDVMLESDRAEEILAHLTKYKYASLEHALIALLWETGLRIGGAQSLDLGDVDFENKSLSVVHRPETGTTLKNGKGGERPVAITTDLTGILKDFTDVNRIEATGESGREPLLSGEYGRISRTTMRRIVYNVTAPHFLGKECPDCNEGSTGKCPEAVNPHAIRRGSITHFLTQDVPVEIVGDRMDVSRKVIDKHYDRRSEEVKLEQRRGYLNKI